VPGWTAWSPSRWTRCTGRDRRGWFKVKHTRTADCVVGGYRLHKRGADLVGSLLLGLSTQDGELASLGRHRQRLDGMAAGLTL
jgi:ATP-dependent DNA ligase